MNRLVILLLAGCGSNAELQQPAPPPNPWPMDNILQQEAAAAAEEAVQARADADELTLQEAMAGGDAPDDDEAADAPADDEATTRRATLPAGASEVSLACGGGDAVPLPAAEGAVTVPIADGCSLSATIEGEARTWALPPGADPITCGDDPADTCVPAP